MFLPASTPQECFDQCADMPYSKAAIISGDGSLCQCVGGDAKKCYVRPAGTPHTIVDHVPLAGTKRVCYTKDVDLNGPEYKDTCTSGHPCESDCEGGFKILQCRDDGHIWHGKECESCDVCDNIWDLTVDWDYEITCEPGLPSTNVIVYMDEDFDGVVDHEFDMPGCWYEEECGQEWEEDDDEDCEDWEDDCASELSDDLSSSPSGTTNHGGGNGWCYSDMNEPTGCAPSPGHCWELCICEIGDELVAIDWEADTGDCWCQDDCECLEDEGEDDVFLITRDSVVPALPHICGDGEGDS